MIVRVNISNHPVLTDVLRYVVWTGFKNLDSDAKTMEMRYRVEYFKGNENITNSFNPNHAPWIVDNSYKVFVPGPDGGRIPNEDWEPHYPVIDGLNGTVADTPDNLEDVWVNAPAFDFFLGMAVGDTPVHLPTLMKKYILKDDVEHKRFD